jgi:hypothetical protein
MIDLVITAILLALAASVAAKMGKETSKQAPVKRAARKEP